MALVSAGRRHVLFVLTGDVAQKVQALRTRWDPVMASRIPPHLSLVYPEETVDESLVLDRVAQAARATPPFEVTLGDLVGSDRGGVWFWVNDPSDTWRRLRSTILTPPSISLPHKAHVTVVHPRTSKQGRKSGGELEGTLIEGDIEIREMLFTETGETGMTILGRFPLLAPTPVRVAVGLLRRGDRVLLCHRRADRESYPDVWDLPGGHVDDGESVAEALVRELEEELAITVDIPAGPPWATLTEGDLELHMFLIDHWRGEPTNSAPDEHDEIRWSRVEDLTDLDLADNSYRELIRRALE